MTATTVTSTIPNPPVLNQYNYEDWSFRIKLYLLAEDLWDVVEATTEPPKSEDGEAEFKAWRKKDAKALILIQNYCGSANYSLILGTKTAKAAWDTLAEKLKPALGPEGDANDLYMPFFQTLLDNDWDAAMEYVRQHPEKLNATFEQFDNGTSLHFVYIRFNNDEIAIPFVLATIEGRVAMSQYLYSASPLETLEDRAYAGVVMSACVVTSRFDILLDLVQRHPKAAFTENKSKVSPFSLLAGMPSFFLSARKLKFWERWIYDGMHVPPTPTPTIDTEKEPTIDAFNDARTNDQKLEGINRIYRMKEIHVRVDEFLQCAMKTIKLKRLQNTSAQVAIAIAIEQGHVEVITHICRANPSLIHDIKIEHLESSVFQLAVEHRQEKTFSLIYKFDKQDQQ
ncbi:unnamed protein product [Prunus armeniaca]|uniref:Uncharacterized protein n=1 Tax=Prunus armeniaca TaxID=36596 RepID=A0A6J5WT94_PRUAR|nr:unnamed protein product [Prunus armeniaca]